VTLLCYGTNNLIGSRTRAEEEMGQMPSCGSDRRFLDGVCHGAKERGCPPANSVF